MRTTIKMILAALLVSLAFVGCDQQAESSEPAPPIQLGVVGPAVEKQLGEKLGAGLVRVGAVRYDKLSPESSQRCYHVEVFYREDDLEKREVITLTRSAGGEAGSPVRFSGLFPISPGNESSQVKRGYLVTIDELMNK